MLYGVPVAVPLDVVKRVEVVVLGELELVATAEVVGELDIVAVDEVIVFTLEVEVVEVRVIAYTPAARTITTITAMITMTDVFIIRKGKQFSGIKS